MHVLACLTILSLIAKTTYASFGFCIALNNPRLRQIAGFKLWNDRGEQAQEYRTLILARKTTLKNNGWTLNLKFGDGDGFILDQVDITSDKYGNIGEVAFENVCIDNTAIYYGCYSNDVNNYCIGNRVNQTNYCRTSVDMGSDSVRC